LPRPWPRACRTPTSNGAVRRSSRLRLGGALAGGTRVVNRDDDRLYRWGLFSFNRDDPAVLVPKRFGVGWTLNLARPAT
jgi:uncharacterized membrane protein